MINKEAALKKQMFQYRPGSSPGSQEKTLWLPRYPAGLIPVTFVILARS